MASRACQASHPSGAEAQQAQAVVEASAAEVTRWESVHSAYRHHLEMVSLIVHPWRLVDSTRQTSHEVERQLHAETWAIEALMETNGLPVKKKALDKVRKQIAGVADRLLPGLGQIVRHLRDGLSRPAQAAQLQQHGQVDAGDHFHLPLGEEGEAEVGGRSAEKVGEQQDPVALIDAADGLFDLVAHVGCRGDHADRRDLRELAIAAAQRWLEARG